MSSGFIVFTETDYGSKGRAKAATEQFPKELSAQAKWRLINWWEKVLATARALCPIDTATLAMSGRIEKAGADIGGYFEKAVTPEHELIDSMIVFGGILVNPKTGRICDYAQAVHDGHFTRSGRWIPPRPFIQEAVNIHINELYHIINQALDRTINTVWIGE
jgi:hypothetical protein